MRHAALFTLFALLTTGCARKNVPVEALASVPADRVDDLGASQQVVRSAQREVTDLNEQIAQISAQLDAARKSLKESDVDLSEAKNAKAVSVLQADSTSARELGTDIASAEERKERAQQRVDRLEHELAVTTARRDVEEARLDLHTRELELDKAKYASEGGADVDIERYEKLVAKASKEVDKRQSDLAEVQND